MMDEQEEDGCFSCFKAGLCENNGVLCYLCAEKKVDERKTKSEAVKPRRE